MSVHKYAGTDRWIVRWREADRNRSRSFRTRQQAQAFDQATRDRLNLGAHGPAEPSTETLGAWLHEWWDRSAHTWSKSTMYNRASILDNWIVPHLGAVRLKDLGTPQVEAWRNSIIHPHADRQASRQTANKALQVLSAALGAARRARRLPDNPCRDVDALPIPRKALRALSPEQVERIRRHLPTQRDRLLWSLISLAGLRTQEALALRWSDLEGDVVVVERAVVDGELKGTKTGHARRVRLLGVLRADLDAARPAAAGDGLVCPSASGGFVDLRNWRARVFAPAAARAGVAGTTPYAGRHAFASLLTYAGHPLTDVAAQMGHADGATTAKHYQHLFDGVDLRDLVDPDQAVRDQRRRFGGPFVEPDVPQMFQGRTAGHLRLVA